jgi:hypothetical protein
MQDSILSNLRRRKREVWAAFPEQVRGLKCSSLWLLGHGDKLRGNMATVHSLKQQLLTHVLPHCVALPMTKSHHRVTMFDAANVLTCCYNT